MFKFPVLRNAQTLGDEGIKYESDIATPLVFSFRGQDQWKPFSKAVFQVQIRQWPRRSLAPCLLPGFAVSLTPFGTLSFAQMTVKVPSRLHRFVRFVVKTSFRFVSGALARDLSGRRRRKLTDGFQSERDFAVFFCMQALFNCCWNSSKTVVRQTPPSLLRHARWVGGCDLRSRSAT